MNIKYHIYKTNILKMKKESIKKAIFEFKDFLYEDTIDNYIR